MLVFPSLGCLVLIPAPHYPLRVFPSPPLPSSSGQFLACWLQIYTTSPSMHGHFFYLPTFQVSRVLTGQRRVLIVAKVLLPLLVACFCIQYSSLSIHYEI